MFTNLLIKLNTFLLRNVRLSIENRTTLVNVLLDELKAFRIKEIITFSNGGTMLVNGKPLSLESSKKIREDAAFLLNSTTREIVKDAVTFKAVSMGIHNGDTPEKMFFGRAALWFMQQEEEFYKLLAQEEEREV